MPINNKKVMDTFRRLRELDDIASEKSIVQSAVKTMEDRYRTKLSDKDEAEFQKWYEAYASLHGVSPNPDDLEHYYDYRGFYNEGPMARLRGLLAEHLPDTYKVPGHPTFSDESMYYKYAPGLAGHWESDEFIPPVMVDQDSIKLRQRWAESSFNDKAKSEAGALGAYQIMPGTYKEYAKKLGKEGNLLDPKYNEQMRDAIWEDLYNSGTATAGTPLDTVRTAKALAMYNRGRGAVASWLQKQKDAGVDIYGSLDWVDSMPWEETRNYVNFILNGKDTGGHRNEKAFEEGRAKFGYARGGLINRFDRGGLDSDDEAEYRDRINPSVITATLPDVRSGRGNQIAYNMANRIRRGELLLEDVPQSYRNYVEGIVAPGGSLDVARAINENGVPIAAPIVGAAAAGALGYAMSGLGIGSQAGHAFKVLGNPASAKTTAGAVAATAADAQGLVASLEGINNTIEKVKSGNYHIGLDSDDVPETLLSVLGAVPGSSALTRPSNYGHLVNTVKGLRPTPKIASTSTALNSLDDGLTINNLESRIEEQIAATEARMNNIRSGVPSTNDAYARNLTRIEAERAAQRLEMRRAAQEYLDRIPNMTIEELAEAHPIRDIDYYSMNLGLGLTSPDYIDIDNPLSPFSMDSAVRTALAERRASLATSGRAALITEINRPGLTPARLEEINQELYDAYINAGDAYTEAMRDADDAMVAARRQAFRQTARAERDAQTTARSAGSTHVNDGLRAGESVDARPARQNLDEAAAAYEAAGDYNERLSVFNNAQPLIEQAIQSGAEMPSQFNSGVAYARIRNTVESMFNNGTIDAGNPYVRGILDKTKQSAQSKRLGELFDDYVKNYRRDFSDARDNSAEALKALKRKLGTEDSRELLRAINDFQNQPEEIQKIILSAYEAPSGNARHYGEPLELAERKVVEDELQKKFTEAGLGVFDYSILTDPTHPDFVQTTEALRKAGIFDLPSDIKHQNWFQVRNAQDKMSNLINRYNMTPEELAVAHKAKYDEAQKAISKATGDAGVQARLLQVAMPRGTALAEHETSVDSYRTMIKGAASSVGGYGYSPGQTSILVHTNPDGTPIYYGGNSLQQNRITFNPDGSIRSIRGLKGLDGLFTRTDIVNLQSRIGNMHLGQYLREHPEDIPLAEKVLQAARIMDKANVESVSQAMGSINRRFNENLPFPVLSVPENLGDPGGYFTVESLINKMLRVDGAATYMQRPRISVVKHKYGGLLDKLNSAYNNDRSAILNAVRNAIAKKSNL